MTRKKPVQGGLQSLEMSVSGQVLVLWEEVASAASSSSSSPCFALKQVFVGAWDAPRCQHRACVAEAEQESHLQPLSSWSCVSYHSSCLCTDPGTQCRSSQVELGWRVRCRFWDLLGFGPSKGDVLQIQMLWLTRPTNKDLRAVGFSLALPPV